MAKTVKFGVIGCGNIALGKHRKAFEKTPEAEVVCTCDLVEEKAIDGMKQMGAKSYYTDAQKMLDEADIDAVLVTTPHTSHAALTMMAAKAGKHVQVEKPAAGSVEEVDDMIRTANEAGIKLVMLPAYPSTSFLMAKKLVDDGVLGDIVDISGSTYNDIFPPEPWYISPKAGFGATADLGVYSLAPILALFGRPDTVFSLNMRGVDTVTMRDGKEYKLEQEAVAKVIMTWGTKKMASVSAAWQAGNMGSRVTVCGRKGSIVLDGWGADDLYYTPARSADTADLTAGKEEVGFLNTKYTSLNQDTRGQGKVGLDDLVAAINEDKDMSESYACARTTLEVILAAYESVKSGRPVSLK
jgi:predicted dehydrogenase